MAARYDEAFADLPVALPPKALAGDTHAWHLYELRLTPQAPISRDHFIERMAEAGIGCSVHFIPLHLHPYWRERYALKPGDFPIPSPAMKLCQPAFIYPHASGGQERVIARSVACLHDVEVFLRSCFLPCGACSPFAALCCDRRLDPRRFRRAGLLSPGAGRSSRNPFRIFKFRTMHADAEARGRTITVGMIPASPGPGVSSVSSSSTSCRNCSMCKGR